MEEADGLKVKFEGKNAAEPEQFFDKVLISIGRKPVTSGLGLENTKVKVTERGFITVDKQLRTDDPNIYAIGDIVGNPMLAHKAAAEGKTAVEAIAGHKAAFEPNAIPAVVFTDPEIAWTGLTETEAKEKILKLKLQNSHGAQTEGRPPLTEMKDLLSLLLNQAQKEFWVWQ